MDYSPVRGVCVTYISPSILSHIPGLTLTPFYTDPSESSTWGQGRPLSGIGSTLAEYEASLWILLEGQVSLHPRMHLNTNRDPGMKTPWWVACICRLFFSGKSLRGKTRGSEDKEDSKVWNQEVLNNLCLMPNTFIKNCHILYIVFMKENQQQNYHPIGQS